MPMLLSGISQPTKGRVLIDGIDMGRLMPRDLRCSIGYFSNEVRPFSGTLHENLTLLEHADDRLLDEPTAVLVQTLETTLLSRLQSWLEGRTAIMATHRVLVLGLKLRTVILQNDRLAVDGPPAKCWPIFKTRKRPPDGNHVRRIRRPVARAIAIDLVDRPDGSAVSAWGKVRGDR